MCKFSPYCLPHLQHYTKTLLSIYSTIDAVKEQRNTPIRSTSGVRSPPQRNLLAPINNYKKSQSETNISRQEDKVCFSRSEPKNINIVKANIITVNSIVPGVKYY